MVSNKDMTKFLLGVDVGSSKTHALLCNLRGEVLSLGHAGCGNYEVVGLVGFKDALNKAIQSALSQAKVQHEQILAMGFGISGYDWPSEESLIIEAIQSLEIDCKYRFVNDVLIGLFAGSIEGWGVAVDAGTGNNVRGLDKQGRIGRITGNSAWFGEIGGAGEMVWLAQIAVTHAWTKRGPKTRLTQMMMAFTGVETEFALIEGLATDQLNLPPILAKDIFQLAQEGDLVASEIVNKSAHELALNVNAVIQQIDLQKQHFDLVMIGSIFKAGEPFIRPFRETVKSFAPHANLIFLSTPPVIGSVLLAADVAGINPGDIRERLINSIQTFLVHEGIETAANKPDIRHN